MLVQRDRLHMYILKYLVLSQRLIVEVKVCISVLALLIPVQAMLMVEPISRLQAKVKGHLVLCRFPVVGSDNPVCPPTLQLVAGMYD